jgi:hypothetical protein
MDEPDRMTFVTIEPAVVPYSFEVWHARRSGRRGGAACFRGECRPGVAGATDARMLRWWISEFYEVASVLDGLVIHLWEFGRWHPGMSFSPCQSDLPATFRALVVVRPNKVAKARRLWGEDCVRDDPAAANDEMDAYLDSLGTPDAEQNAAPDPAGT